MVELKEIRMSSTEKNIPTHIDEKERTYFSINKCLDVVVDNLCRIVKRYDMSADDYDIDYCTGNKEIYTECTHGNHVLDSLGIDYVCYRKIPLRNILRNITDRHVKMHRKNAKKYFTGRLAVIDNEVFINKQDSILVGIKDSNTRIFNSVVGEVVVNLSELEKKGCFIVRYDGGKTSRQVLCEWEEIEECCNTVNDTSTKNVNSTRTQTETSSLNDEQAFTYFVDSALRDSCFRRNVSATTEGYLFFYSREPLAIDKNIFIEYCIERRNAPMNYQEIESFSILSGISAQRLALEYLNTQIKLFMIDGTINIRIIVRNMCAVFYYDLIHSDRRMLKEFNVVVLKLYELVEEKICEGVMEYDAYEDVVIHMLFMVMVSGHALLESRNKQDRQHTFEKLFGMLKENCTQSLFKSCSYSELHDRCERMAAAGSGRLVDNELFNRLINRVIERNRCNYDRKYRYTAGSTDKLRKTVDGCEHTENDSNEWDDLVLLNKISRLVPFKIQNANNVYLRERVIRYFKRLIERPWQEIKHFFYELKNSTLFRTRIYISYEGYEDVLDINEALLAATTQSATDIFVFLKKVTFDDLKKMHAHMKEMHYLFGDSFEMFYHLERMRVTKRYVAKHRNRLADAVAKRRYRVIEELLSKGKRFEALGVEGYKCFRMVLYEECLQVVRNMDMLIDMEMCRMIIK